MNSQYLHCLCTNIRILRIYNRLSQKEMAKILGISVRSLHKIETGVVPPLLQCSALEKACRYFHLSFKDLFLPLPGMEMFY